MASHEHHVKSEIHVETLHGRADARMLYRVQRTGVPGNPESEPPEGVSRELKNG